MANWLRCLVVVTRKITLNTSVTHWAPSATSLNRAVQPLLVTGQLRAYHFEASKGLADDDHFVGLAIDEDRQPELTAERVENGLNRFLKSCISTKFSMPDVMRRRLMSTPY